MSETHKLLAGSEYRVTHSVGPNQAGIRLDRFLMDHYHRRSREQLKRAIDSGAITVFRHTSPHLHLGRIKPSFALQPGDIVNVLSVKNAEPEVNFNYEIIYEDDAILVIHKPPNLPVHPAGRYFFHTLLIHLKTDGFKIKRAQEGGRERDFFLVHRIDKETSGILLMAKTREACQHLTLQFRERETSKSYLAVCRGIPREKKFQINRSIGKIEGSRIGLKMYPLDEEKGGFSAITDFEILETRVDQNGIFYSLMACFPHTGRQHQIRAHAEIAGIPLVGDKIYGLSDDKVMALLEDYRDQSNPEKEVPELLLPRHALHAAGLKFLHPNDNREMAFELPLPADLRSFFEALTLFRNK